MELKYKLTFGLLLILVLLLSVSLVTSDLQSNFGRSLNVSGNITVGGSYFNFTNSNAFIYNGNITWNSLYNHPVACPLGSFITQLGDSVTCSTPSNLTQNVTFLDDIYLSFGNSSDSLFSCLAINVPVFAIGDRTSQDGDLGVFNGETSPTLAILSNNADAYLGIFHGGAAGYATFEINNSGGFQFHRSNAVYYQFALFGGSETVFNEGQFDIDTRMESDNNANMFTLDAGLESIGIGRTGASGTRLIVGGNFAAGNDTHILQTDEITFTLNNNMSDARFNYFGKPTVSGAFVVDNGATVYIAGPIINLSGAIVTRNNALWVNGSSRFDGIVLVANNTALSFGDSNKNWNLIYNRSSDYLVLSKESSPLFAINTTEIGPYYTISGTVNTTYIRTPSGLFPEGAISAGKDGGSIFITLGNGSNASGGAPNAGGNAGSLVVRTGRGGVGTNGGIDGQPGSIVALFETGTRFMHEINMRHNGTAGIVTSGKGNITLVKDVTVTQELRVAGIEADGSGKAVCIKADGFLGTCSDAVGGGGTCTCS